MGTADGLSRKMRPKMGALVPKMITAALAVSSTAPEKIMNSRERIRGSSFGVGNSFQR